MSQRVTLISHRIKFSSIFAEKLHTVVVVANSLRISNPAKKVWLIKVWNYLDNMHSVCFPSTYSPFSCFCKDIFISFIMTWCFSFACTRRGIKKGHTWSVKEKRRREILRPLWMRKSYEWPGKRVCMFILEGLEAKLEEFLRILNRKSLNKVWLLRLVYFAQADDVFLLVQSLFNHSLHIINEFHALFKLLARWRLFLFYWAHSALYKGHGQNIFTQRVFHYFIW